MIGWSKLTPWTKRTIVIAIAVVLVASMYFGYFGDIIDLFKNEAKK